jgi:hypothetical protein
MGNHDPDRDRLTFPPRRSDIVMLMGILAMVFTGLHEAWGAFAGAVILLLVGLFAPRMKGPFSLGGPKLNFKGELTDPDGRAGESDGAMRGLDAQPARLLDPGPPASSQLPPGQQQ